MPCSEEREWIGTKEAAYMMGVSYQTVQRWLREGDPRVARSKKEGYKWAVHRDDILDFIQPKRASRA